MAVSPAAAPAMIIIFGTSHKSKRERPLIDTYCFECKRTTTWDWYKVTEWISAFFIPVLPVRDEHFLVCSTCGDQLQMDRDEARGVKRRTQLAPDESQRLHDRLIERLETHQLSGKSETQREYLRSQRRQRT